MTTVDALAPTEPVAASTLPTSGWRRFARRFARQRVSLVAATVLLLIVLAAVFAPWISPYDPAEQNLQLVLAEPFTDGHVLGTDELGRDVLSRLIYGARFSLMASALAVGIGLVVGFPLGVVAGYRGGRIDWALMRLTDALMSFPSIILAITVVAALGPGLTNAMIAVGIVFAPRLARLARDATLGVNHATYVEAARSMGLPHRSIVWRHIVPHILSPMIVMVSILAGHAMIIEAGLSFLGLGVVPPDASWGSILSGAFRFNANAPLLIVWPGVCIVVTVLCLNLVGDGLKDSVGRETRRG